jgi:hypothetical protein
MNKHHRQWMLGLLNWAVQRVAAQHLLPVMYQSRYRCPDLFYCRSAAVAYSDFTLWLLT